MQSSDQLLESSLKENYGIVNSQSQMLLRYGENKMR